MRDVVCTEGGEKSESQKGNSNKAGPKESISILPVSMRDVVCTEGGEKSELKKVSSKRVRFEKKIPDNKLRRSTRSMKK